MQSKSIIVHCCYPVLESGSTAVTGGGLDGGYKSATLQFVLHQQSQLELIVPQVQVRSRYASQALWCLLGKSSYAEQGKRLCSLGDAVIHQLSEWLDYSILPQVRTLPVKLPQAVCPQAVN